jgi:hypothetical protein
VFLDCYLNLLSKRLLLNKFSSLEHEEEAVTKMRDLFGLHFTHRIANLITNYKLVTDKWRDDVVDVPPTEDKVEFRMLPLQLSCWPQLQLFEGVSLPHEMAFLRRRFQTKYEAENPSHVVRQSRFFPFHVLFARLLLLNCTWCGDCVRCASSSCVGCLGKAPQPSTLRLMRLQSP